METTKPSIRTVQPEVDDAKNDGSSEVFLIYRGRVDLPRVKVKDPELGTRSKGRTVGVVGRRVLFCVVFSFRPLPPIL